MLGFLGLCWALLGLVGLCWALLGFAWLCWALLGFAGLCWALLAFAGFYRVLLLLGASEASEQSERAKLSDAFSGFPLLTHAFVGAPLLSLAFCCFASLHVVWHFLLNGALAFPHSRSILFLAAPCLVLFSLVLPCANIA